MLPSTLKNRLIAQWVVFLKNSNAWIESLWVKIRDKATKGNLVGGVYYRPPREGRTLMKHSDFNYRKHHICRP